MSDIERTIRSGLWDADGQDKAQKLIDMVVEGMNKQGWKPSFLPGSKCAYRGADGCACAVGTLIKDEHYETKLEGSTTTTVVVRRAVEASVGFELDGHMWYLLRELQKAHDNAHWDVVRPSTIDATLRNKSPAQRMQLRMGAVATSFGLIFATPDQPE